MLGNSRFDERDVLLIVGLPLESDGGIAIKMGDRQHQWIVVSNFLFPFRQHFFTVHNGSSTRREPSAPKFQSYHNYDEKMVTKDH